jgi:hypothetical protein
MNPKAVRVVNLAFNFTYLQEVKAVDPPRRRVLVAQQSDRLKADLRSVSWAGLFNFVNQVAKTAP